MPSSVALTDRPVSVGASWLRGLHLVTGVAALVAFLLTGQYMDRVHDHLQGMDDARRMLFRSAHIYLLFSSLVHLSLGLYLVDAPAGWRRLLQRMGSALLLAGPVLLLVAFVREPWLSGLERPYARPAIYWSLAGVVAHAVSRARATFHAP